jgi:hypothetical protein
MLNLAQVLQVSFFNLERPVYEISICLTANYRPVPRILENEARDGRTALAMFHL